MDKIILKDLRFYGHHGCTEEERKVGQPYIANLEIACDLSYAGENDFLDDSIDYSEVCRVVVKIGESEEFLLIEALAERLAEEILKKFPKTDAVKIRISKPRPPIREILEEFAVEISRERKNVAKK